MERHGKANPSRLSPKGFEGRADYRSAETPALNAAFFIRDGDFF
jgi:hypothetical protein